MSEPDRGWVQIGGRWFPGSKPFQPACILTLSPAGRWVCLAHDVEAEPRLPDAYVSNPGPEDFKCPIGEEA